MLGGSLVEEDLVRVGLATAVVESLVLEFCFVELVLVELVHLGEALRVLIVVSDVLVVRGVGSHSELLLPIGALTESLSIALLVSV